MLIFAEIACVAAIFLAGRLHHIYFSKVPYLLALAWMSLLVRGVRWRDVGLRLPPRLASVLVLGVVAGLAMEAMELFVTQPVLVSLTGKFPNLSEYRSAIGNVKLLVALVASSWVVAAFGEELVYRGYFLNRLTDLFGKGAWGWALSFAGMAVVFGLSHSVQGVTGVVENTIDGALLGLLYVATGRNLLAPIVAHGVTDTADFVIIFLGRYPGLHQ